MSIVNPASSSQSLSFDKELSDCRSSGGDCQAVIDKWKKVSDKQSADTEQKLKDNPLEAQVVDKEIAQGGTDMTERPGWLGNDVGLASASRPSCLYGYLNNIYNVIALSPKLFIFNVSLILYPLFPSEKIRLYIKLNGYDVNQDHPSKIFHW